MDERANRSEDTERFSMTEGATSPQEQSTTTVEHQIPGIDSLSVSTNSASLSSMESAGSMAISGVAPVSSVPGTETTNRLIGFAIALSAITIVYNVIEGIVSIVLGGKDETLALMGFGIDSFVEVMSAVGVLHMTLRMRSDGAMAESRERFEKRALKITGYSFYILVAGIIAASVIQVLRQIPPESTFWGMVITGISILGMGLLIRGKTVVGRRLNSPAILADANCSRSCLYLSGAVFLSGLFYEWTGILYADTLGALAVALFAFKEGKESIAKSRSNGLCGCHDSCQ